MRITFDVNVNLNMARDPEIMQLLNKIINQNTNTMAKLTDLEAQVDAQSAQITELQTSLDSEQEQIKAAVEALNTTIATNTQTIADLQQQLADLGASQEIIDRVVGKLTANNQAIADVKTDLEGTIPDAPIEPPTV